MLFHENLPNHWNFQSCYIERRCFFFFAPSIDVCISHVGPYKLFETQSRTTRTKFFIFPSQW